MIAIKHTSAKSDIAPAIHIVSRFHERINAHRDACALPSFSLIGVHDDALTSTWLQI
jgi:hypothetical protein